jgi:hypothetical protein
MKQCHCIIALVLLFSPGLSAQGVYPLQKGNLWEYWTWDYLNGQVSWTYGWTDKVVGDTLLPNGKLYAVMSSDGPGWYGWLNEVLIRQDSLAIFMRGMDSSSDSLLYDFGRTTGDTLWSHPHGGFPDTMTACIVYDRLGVVFGEQRRQCGYYYVLSHYTYYLLREITEGFGLTFQESEGGDQWFLRGAIIRGVTYGTVTSAGQDLKSTVPIGFEAYQNYPNPFNSSTTISYAVPRQQQVVVTVYSILGKEVRRLLDRSAPPGTYAVYWDGRDNEGRAVSSGAYIYRAQSGGHTMTRVMTLIR